ncbi:MAG: hypothetical protein KGJ88_09090 [Verrucomicrobiota bacterium]|nr:hypothetical protein [Verrucomicrobiota bacterium]
MFTPEQNRGKVLRQRRRLRQDGNMPDIIYIAMVIFIFAALALYACGCEKL